MGNLGSGGFKSSEHRSVFPEGRFSFLIQGSDLIDAMKDGMKIGTDWEFKLTCITPSHINRKLTRRMAYERDSKDAKVRQQIEIGGNQIADICRAVNVPEPGDTKDLLNLKFDCDVAIKGDFNNIKKITAYTPPLVTTKPKNAVSAPADAQVSKPEDWNDEGDTTQEAFEQSAAKVDTF